MSSAKPTPAKKSATVRTAIFVTPEQLAWLQSRPKGISAAVRALIVEAMNMEQLVRSAAGRKKQTRK